MFAEYNQLKCLVKQKIPIRTGGMSETGARRGNKLRRAESTRAVEQAACHLFVRRGFLSTSMDMIAREVDLTKGAVYFYYKDKEALLLTLLAQSEAQLFTQVFEAMDSVEGADKRIKIFLDRIGRAGAEIEQNLILLPVLMSAEFKGRADAVERALKEIYARVYDKLSGVIRAGQADGVFTNPANAQALATMIVALTDGLLIEIYRQSSGLDGKDILRTARTTVLSLLQAG